MTSMRSKIETLLASGSAGGRRPVLRRGFESSVRGIHVIGDLAGAPVIKLAMAQGVEVIEHIAGRLGPQGGDVGDVGDVVDVLVVGAGAAGLNAALAAADHGLSCTVIEKGGIANTIEDFPEGKWVYAEPDATPPKGKLWLDGARKEDLIERWHHIVEDNGLDVRTEEALESVSRAADGTFEAKTAKGAYRARRIVLATGQRGSPRKLDVPGEDLEHVYHRLYSPRSYEGEHILVVGGGNSAVEAALTLAEANRVVMSYRGGEFARIFKDNRRRLDEAIAAGHIEVVLSSNVTGFRPGQADLEIDRGGHRETRTIRTDHAFVLIGAELPVKFLRGLGIRLENDWTGSPLLAAGFAVLVLVGLWFLGGRASAFGADLSAAVPTWMGGAAALAGAGLLVVQGIRGSRWAWLGFSFLVWYSIYGIKVGKGEEFWPFRGWGYESVSFLDRPWAFWYTVMYTALMTIFGFQALKRWGLDRRDKFQILRFGCLIAFQWVFFFIIPEYLFQAAIKHQWVGEALASDPQFAGEAWRSYGLVYAWPLFFYTFFYDPHMVWVVWGVLLAFVIIPIFVIFAGKRYCSWICGCGGLAETFGDRWRHLAPKGKSSIRWEWMNLAILILAVAVTAAMLGRDVVGLVRQPAEWGVHAYRIMVDVWLVGILPVTLYPFMGGKVWCRYWCPLAKFMGLLSHLYARLGISKFKITANDKCIACSECSRNCQVGIDVMQYALKQEVLDNRASSCIGCGICVTVCPMDVLVFGEQQGAVAGKPSADR